MTTYPCPLCYGAGELHYLAIDPNGPAEVWNPPMMPVTETCSICHGTGTVDEAIHAEWEALRAGIRAIIHEELE